MRVAALSDIHGNLPALEAVLADVERERVDEIVVVGDTICGPWPAETFDLLAMRTSEAPNIEDQLIRYLLDPPDPEETTRYFESVRGS